MATAMHRWSSGTALVVVAMVAALLTGGSAQSSSCTTSLVSLMPCLGYLSGTSSTPSQQCCSQLSSFVQSNTRCLCTLLNGASSLLPINIPINQTQALALPGACKIQTPSVSQCNASSPEAAPKPSSPTTVPPTTSLTTMPSGNGSKATPASGQSSDASSTKLTLSLFFLLFFTSSCASALFNF